MVDTFNFESKYRELGTIKVLDFQTSDGTEWKLSEEWLATQRREKTILQRIIFCKQNNYDRHYIVKMEITSLTNLTAGKIQVSKGSGPVFTSIIVPLDQFRVFRYSVGFQYRVNGVNIFGRVLSDRFRYKVTISRAYVLQGEGGNQEIPPREELLAFSDQIHWLLETGHFSDVILTNGEFQIRAHKSILASRCNYFRNMFASKMMEVGEAAVYLPDVSEHVLKEVLNFIYSGVFRPIEGSTALEMLNVADMYQFDELKMYCTKVLERKISVENAAEILLLAHSQFHQDLKAFSLKFILDNFAKVQVSDSWTDLGASCPALFNEVLEWFQARTAVRD